MASVFQEDTWKGKLLILCDSYCL